jgi:hypothetical protein
MSIDVAFQRFRDANPVPNPAALQPRPVDSDVFVASTQQRSMHMQSTKTDHVDLEPPRRRPRIASALAIAAALVVVGFGVGMLTSNRTGDQAAAGLERRVALVAAQAAAYSDGDFDGWVSYYTPDASLGNSGLTAGGPDIKILFPVSAAANEQWVITGLCQQGASPEQTSCPMRQRDDFYGPAGLAVEAVYTFTFDEDDKIIAYELDQGRAIAFAPWNTFDVRFAQWLQEVHPEVDVKILFDPNLSGVIVTAEYITTALLYVDEFIAQSDDYPIQQDAP